MSEPEIAEFWRHEEELEAKKKKVEISRVKICSLHLMYLILL